LEARTRVGVILAAGGSSLRMGSHLPKQFSEIGGKPLYQYSLETFSTFSEVDEIILVVPESEISKLEPEIKPFPKTRLAAGGTLRWESVKKGFQTLTENINLILVHDVARLFIPKSVIRNCISHVAQGKTVVPGIPSPDTLKEVENSSVIKTVDRSRLIQVQTPQGFPRRVLEKIYLEMKTKTIPPEKATDEAGMAEYMELPVIWFEGSKWAKKVTYKEDILWAEWVAGSIEKGNINLNEI